MGQGGYHPFPKRMGGGKPPLQVMHESLNRQAGSAFDAHPATVVSCMNMAIARALVFDGIEVNARLANQGDPRKLTDNLPRWERIFGLRPARGASLVDRRAAVVACFLRFAERSAVLGRMQDLLRRELPDLFVGLDFIAPDKAVMHVPSTAYPWGSVVAGFPWYSTTAHMLVLLRKPEGWTEGEFYKAAGRVYSVLRPIKPSWMTVKWYRAPAIGAPINVPGGPRAGGFYLDNPHTLDNSVFAR